MSDDWLRIRELTTPEELERYYRLRYHIYREAGYLQTTDSGLDLDPYDPFCLCLGAFDRRTGGTDLIGGIRLILPRNRWGAERSAAVRAAVEKLQPRCSSPPGCATYLGNSFDLEPVEQFCRSQALELAEFGRNVCRPEYRRAGIGSALVHCIHALALREGIAVGVAGCPPGLLSYYQRLGCTRLTRKPLARSQGRVDTDLVAMAIDLRALNGSLEAAYRAAEQLRRQGQVRLCEDPLCLLSHLHHDRQVPPVVSDGSLYDWSIPEEQVGLLRPGVTLHDETLRDGLQGPSVGIPELTTRSRLLEHISGLGIETANLGLPGAGERFIEECAQLLGTAQRLGLKPTLAGRTVDADIEAIAEAGQRAGVRPEAGLFLGTSEVRRACESWSPEQLLKTTRTALKRARALGLPVMFVTEDTVRSRPELLRALFLEAIELGARRLCLCDTTGHANPAGTRRLVHFARTVVAESQSRVQLDWHGHRDRGLAVANSLAAICAGVDRVHATALGLGERCGNTPMESLLRALHRQAARPLDEVRLQAYLAAVAQACGRPCPAPALPALREVVRA